MALGVTEDNLPPNSRFMTKWGEEQYVVVGDSYFLTKTLGVEAQLSLRCTKLYFSESQPGKKFRY